MEGRSISRTEKLGLVAMEECWSTPGVVGGEAEVEIQVESLTGPQIRRNITLASGSSGNLGDTLSLPVFAMNNCLYGS